MSDTPLLRYCCDSCTFQTEIRVHIKMHAATLGHFGWTDREATPTRATDPWLDATDRVLARVREHRQEQVRRYGLQRGSNGLVDGTGPGVRWLPQPLAGLIMRGVATAVNIESAFRADYEEHGGDRRVNWLRLLREEFAEVAMEKDPEKLAEELVQVSALAVSWLEDLESRKAAPGE